MDNQERYYPASLVAVYFTWCAANDEKPSAEGMHQFIDEVQGTKHLNGISSHRTIEELFGHVIERG